MLQTQQIGINTSDIVKTLRLYNEAFGFQNGGGQACWGDAMRIQGLSPDACTLVWWMVGRNERFQFEIFHHTEPQQRPQPADWRPHDHGWVRIGIALTDLDAALSYLAQRGVSPLGELKTIKGVRSAAIRDPYAGIVLELIQDGPELAARTQVAQGEGPAVVYVTSSVSDLDSARDFYANVLGHEIEPLETLHDPEHEALWGLDGATRSGFVARVNDIALEIVQYSDPVGRPRREDHVISDQGIMNVAVGSRRGDDIRELVKRAEATGLQLPFVVDQGEFYGGYLTAPEREIELASIPEAFDELLGFPAQPAPFLGSALA